MHPKNTRAGRPIKRSQVMSILLALFLLLYGCYAIIKDPPPERETAELSIHYLDVGQADATLLLLPNGQNMLIDAGDNETSDHVIQYIRSQGVKTLDYIVATHPHADHIGGMDRVIETFTIGDFYMPRLPENQLPTTRTFEDMLLALEQEAITPKEAKKDTVIFSDENLRIDILSPTELEYEDLNHYSAVILVQYGNRRFLFMGDTEKDNEKALLREGYDLRADVLKVGHHGSRKTSSTDFLQAVSPRWAVISCGLDNSYGHPHKETLQRLQKRQVEIYRTDQDATLVLRTNGDKLEIQTTR